MISLYFFILFDMGKISNLIIQWIVLLAGTFGQVLECFDDKHKEAVAIKVIRSVPKYREAAMIEIDVLQRLARHDVGGSR